MLGCLLQPTRSGRASPAGNAGGDHPQLLDGEAADVLGRLGGRRGDLLDPDYGKGRPLTLGERKALALIGLVAPFIFKYS